MAGGPGYVAGTTTLGSDEGVVLKFDPNSNLIWQRARSAGSFAQEIGAVVTAADGGAYVAGSTIDFANSTPAGMSITKIAADGTPGVAEAGQEKAALPASVLQKRLGLRASNASEAVLIR